MELTKTSVFVAASILLLACSSLSQECNNRVSRCNNQYVDSVSRRGGDTELVCNDLKTYKRCIYVLDCVPEDRKKSIIDQARNNLYGIECDLNGASRTFGVSFATAMLAAIFAYLSKMF